MVIEEIKVKEKFSTIRQKTEDICKPLKPEDMVVQPVEEVSPPKWHLAHTTWFFETFVLKEYLEGYSEYHPDFPFLFNSYYVGAGERMIRGHRGNITRPTVDEVLSFRQHVNDAVIKLLDAGVDQKVIDLIEIGLHHEQQHQELLIYDLKYILGHNPTFPPYINSKPTQSKSNREESFLTVEEGKYEIGHNSNGFCYDNELGYHTVFLHEFEIMDRLVTNGEYLQFMESGQYKTHENWLSEGWEWVKENNIESPEYWHKIDKQWMYYSLKGGLQPIDLNAPVTHISYFEAAAYANWKGMRLPSEFEWEVACSKYGANSEASNFVESEYFQPFAGEAGNKQFYGDAWEWTSSAYLPYPFYEAPPGALGEYNGKFMINQMVLRGGSCATQKDHIRHTYRNFFHPHLRWMFSGLRLARHTKDYKN